MNDRRKSMVQQKLRLLLWCLTFTLGALLLLVEVEAERVVAGILLLKNEKHKSNFEELQTVQAK